MIRIGTSGYDYPEWRGSFYPEEVAAGRRLAYYAGQLDTVEINYTFYRTPSVASVQAWAADTPPAFRFTLKAPKRITHDRRLQDIGDPLAFFLDRARLLGDRLGCVLFQLPPNFRKDPGRLAGLLAALPADIRAAVEFRHASWFDEEVYGLLRDRVVALCIADTEDGTTPRVATAPFGYLRLRDEGYGDEELDAWAQAVRRPEWSDAYVYFKHESAGQAPVLARRLRDRLGPPGPTGR